MTRDESCVLDMREMPALIHHHEARIRQALTPQRRIRRRHDLVGVAPDDIIDFLLHFTFGVEPAFDHLTSVIRSLPYSLQAPALLQSHGGGVGITSDGGQVVVSCGDLPEPWISTDHKHAVISLR